MSKKMFSLRPLYTELFGKLCKIGKQDTFPFRAVVMAFFDILRWPLTRSHHHGEAILGAVARTLLWQEP